MLKVWHQPGNNLKGLEGMFIDDRNSQLLFIKSISMHKSIKFFNYMTFWSNPRDNDGNLGMHQQASGQQHSLLSQSAHFVNGPFPATLQVSVK